MKHKQTSWRRLLASILSILLLVNTTGLSAIAESGSNHTVSQKGLINSFEELPASTVEQTVSPGTAVSSLNLPSKVKAEVIWNFEGEDNKTATDSNSTPLASDSNSTQTAIRQQMDVEVDWTEQPAYDAQKEGTYLFTAVPRDFSLNSGVKPPEITVHVSSSAAPLKQTITGFGNLSATEYIVAKGTKESELPLEKTIPVMFNGSSQTSILPVTWVCISDSFGNALYNPDHENDSVVFTFLPKWDENLFVLGSGLTEYNIPTVDIKFNTGINLLNKGLDPLNLIPGETYWFDLSAEQIPGTPNKGDNAGGVMVPDKTFHYIPFTYVGTINAYKKTDRSVSTDTNVQAEDETLFLSDYNIVRDVSWNMLNDKDLIFGTSDNYRSGGVSYTLRSPSVGSVTKYSAPYACEPTSNEWDTIYEKDKAYIKNTFHYYTIGQDTYSNTTYDQVVVRGSNRPDTSTVVSRHYQATPADSSNLGFRPVLELEDFDFLAQNGGFHVITLDLKHGYLKNDKKVEKILQIAAASGQDFEAPAGDGFQPPDSGKEFDKWEGDDGNFYASGEIVPYTVNVLSALYKEQSRYNTVYVNGISGDDANDGQSEATPFKTLDHAFGMVADGGTIVICGYTRVLTNYSTVFVPYVAPPRDVTITSNNNSTLYFYRSMILNGDTTFKNLTIDTGSVHGLFANGFKLVMDEGITISQKSLNHTFVLVGGEVFNNNSERMILPSGRGSNVQILDGSYGQWAIIAGPSVSRYSAGGSFIDGAEEPVPIDQTIDARGDLRLLIGGTTSEVRDVYGGVYADETTAKKVAWHDSLIEINAPNVTISNIVAGSRAQMLRYNHTDGTEIRQADDSSTEIHLLDGAVESILGGSEVLEWTGASADFYENISKVIIDGGRLGSYIAAGGVTCSVSVSQSGGPTSDILNEMIIETSEPLDQNGLLASGMFHDAGLGDTNPYQQLSTNLLEVILKDAGEIGTVDIDPSYSGGASSASIRILTIDGTASAAAPKAIPDNFNALRLREGGSAILTADSEFEFLESAGSQGTLILQADNSDTLPAILLKNKVTTDNSILLRVTDINGNSVVQTEGTTLLSFPSEDDPDPGQFILDAANGDFDIIKDGKDLVLAKKTQIITNLSLKGITIPERGLTPSAAITDVQYSGTIAWTPNHSVFKPGVSYTAVIALTPNAGYTLAGLPENAFTADGAVSVTNTAGSNVVHVTFPAIDCMVTFEASNGTTPVNVTIPANGTVSRPLDPVYSGFTFGGWYTDPTLVNEFDFQTKVTGDLTLYAKWSKDPLVITNLNLNPNDITIPERGLAPAATITNTQYTGTIAWTPNDSVFKPGVSYTAVITLTPKAGYTLAGLPENAFTADGAVSVTNTAGSNMVHVTFPAIDCMVTFEASNGTAPVNVTIPANGTVSRPLDPVYSGFTFGGWYTDPTLVNEFDFQTKVTGDLILYAKWNKNQVPVNPPSGSDNDDNDRSSGFSNRSLGNWIQDSIGWWYQYPDRTYPAGTFAWLPCNDQTDWYFFDENGYMSTGWVTFEGRTYYLNPVSDGFRGRMLTGWQLIDGKWYYFNEVSDGTKGALMTDTWIDFYYVDKNGVWNPDAKPE